MINPTSDRQFYMNCFYTLMSVICYSIYAYSFKKNANLKVILLGTMLVTTRFEIRMLDFENTMKDPNSEIGKSEIAKNVHLIMMTIGCTTLILIVA